MSAVAGPADSVLSMPVLRCRSVRRSRHRRQDRTALLARRDAVLGSAAFPREVCHLVSLLDLPAVLCGDPGDQPPSGPVRASRHGQERRGPQWTVRYRRFGG
ncbi:hypothetical protein [Streptomyces atroolivaceus]|uniref:hypothetical protein n=1 Tax=Streptomyces atroolivaceus TaxID=66869 RepID=UPI0037A9E7DC